MLVTVEIADLGDGWLTFPTKRFRPLLLVDFGRSSTKCELYSWLNCPGTGRWLIPGICTAPYPIDVGDPAVAVRYPPVPVIACEPFSKSGGMRSRRTSKIRVCHEKPLNMSTARPASSAVASRTVPYPRDRLSGPNETSARRTVPALRKRSLRSCQRTR